MSEYTVNIVTQEIEASVVVTAPGAITVTTTDAPAAVNVLDIGYQGPPGPQGPPGSPGSGDLLLDRVNAPQPLGTASPGVSNEAAAADHIHGTDGLATLAGDNTFAGANTFQGPTTVGDGNEDVLYQRAAVAPIDTRVRVFGYNPDGTLDTIEEKVGTTVVKMTRFTYKPDGNIGTATISVGGKTIVRTFAYDAEGNVTSITPTVQ